jgi:leucyl-tRNA synthetase
VSYDHTQIEKKWQDYWEKNKTFEASADVALPKFYPLIEFPYPSGDGLHTGHIRSNTAMDIIARKRRHEGYNVLYPIGWDAFGLPTENYAVKTGTHPRDVTKKNTDTFRRQLKSIGFSFDWSREINTTDPSYYRWTQWIFLKLYERGLAYKARSFINWCPSCNIGLANEEAIGGICERCGGKTEKREKEQWMLAITKYADRLHDDLDTVDYLERVKIQQRNWIGRSEGIEIDFPILANNEKITVFTTRADTLFGVSYLVLAPEHPVLKKIFNDIQNKEELDAYQKKANTLSEIDRTNTERIKTGVLISGVKASHPLTKEELPIYVADYVLASYGTGAVMAVPAHDERDWEFAKKYNLPIKEVIVGGTLPYVNDGILQNSDGFDKLPSELARNKITEAVGGRVVTKYKLRDWVFSRQRYWGEPIPIIFCSTCGTVPVPEKDLPVTLPEMEKYQPTDTGESPLASIADWVNVACPKCGGAGKRETDTMPNWAGSSWYWLRYADPHNDQIFSSKESLQYWTPVDWYNGGMEHTTLHLLYSRFWHKVLFDMGYVPTPEPFTKRTTHGMILAKGGEKMSKSKGNVVNPDAIVNQFGADTLRVYEMFMGPFDQAIMWSPDDIVGSRKFIERLYDTATLAIGANRETTKAVKKSLEETIEKASTDIESMSFNTAIAQMMIFLKELRKEGNTISKEDLTRLIIVANPFMPHLAEELWQALGHNESITTAPWPKPDEEWLKKKGEEVILVQVNGRHKERLTLAPGTGEEEAVRQALLLPKVVKALGGQKPERHIFVPDKVINFLVSLDASHKK